MVTGQWSMVPHRSRRIGHICHHRQIPTRQELLHHHSQSVQCGSVSLYFISHRTKLSLKGKRKKQRRYVVCFVLFALR